MLFAGAAEMLRALHDAGFMLAVATGKSRRGLDRALEATGLNQCFHATRCADEGFSKPHPGMLLAIGQRFEVSLHGVPVVGDSLRDLQAAAQVGASPYLVRTGNGEQTLATGDLPHGTKIFDDLASMVDRLLHAEQAAPETIEMARAALGRKKQH